MDTNNESTESVTITREQRCGAYGSAKGRPYVARLTGSDARYGLNREFLDAEGVTRDHFGRSKYTRTFVWALGPGLYEVRDARGERVFRAVSGDPLRCWTPTSDRVSAVIEALDSGMTWEEARIATRPTVAA